MWPTTPSRDQFQWLRNAGAMPRRPKLPEWLFQLWQPLSEVWKQTHTDQNGYRVFEVERTTNFLKEYADVCVEWSDAVARFHVGGTNSALGCAYGVLAAFGIALTAFGDSE